VLALWLSRIGRRGLISCLWYWSISKR